MDGDMIMGGDKRPGRDESWDSHSEGCSHIPSSSLGGWEAPRLSWGTLGGRATRTLLVERPLVLLYTNFLLQPSGTFRFVVYKVPRVTSEAARAAMVHEAAVLHALRGVRGVPRLYGLAQPPKEAIVMSFCPGEPLQTFLRQEAARTYLRALRGVSLTLKGMHDAGVAHGSLKARSILVAVRQGHGGLAEHVTTSVVGLRTATVGGRCWAKSTDLHSVVGMAQDICRHLTQDTELSDRCRELTVLTALSPARLDWLAVLEALCHVLHGESLSSCSACTHEVWPYFAA